MSKKKLATDWKSLLADSPTRPAGARLTLTIDGEEYGFRWIPPGEFDMGSPISEINRYDDEKLHHVKLTRGFWLLETPVTQGLYERVMGVKPREYEGFDYSKLYDFKNVDFKSFDSLLTFLLETNPSNLPVTCVDYDAALLFCEKLTESMPVDIRATLPSEAQWEYACRAGTKTTYWYGDKPDSNKMNFEASHIGQPTPVTRYAPNSWGLYDMLGNVLEWTIDAYCEYPDGTVTDPVGTDGDRLRTLRGGSWLVRERYCRCAFRSFNERSSRSKMIGFRVLFRCD